MPLVLRIPLHRVISRSLVAGFMAASLTACGGIRIDPAPDHPDPPPHAQPEFLALLTEGIRIEAEDGSWEVIGGGEAIPTPFLGPDFDESQQLSREEYDAQLAASGIADAQRAQLVRSYSPPRVFDVSFAVYQQPELMLDWHRDFLRTGARRVRVHVAGREAPLHGVLALFPVYQSSDSNTRRAYRVEVPPERIAQASGARVSMVFQPYKFPYTQYQAKAVGRAVKWFLTPVEGGHMSWALWLSDAPFPEAR